MGGLKLETAFSTEYRSHLVDHLACGVRGTRGTADLCSYFLLRANSLGEASGQLGFVATNTLAQGDTKQVGLDQLLSNGITVRVAKSSQKWPGAASLEIALVWMSKCVWSGQIVLDDMHVPAISASLTAQHEVVGEPHRLEENAELSFQGSIVLGQGFILDRNEKEELIRCNPQNADVIYPYLTGEDTNSRPDQSPSRWVINFLGWPLSRDSAPINYSGPVAADYPDCISLLETRVKPERLRYEPKNQWNRKVRSEWWLFGQYRWALKSAIEGLQRVLVVAATSRTLAFAFADPQIAFSHAVNVFALPEWEDFAVLQSGVHETWARCYSSSMKGDLRYTPTSCFQTYPRPKHCLALASPSESYYVHRSDIMFARQEGLTKTYNRFHNPDESAADIQKLRELQVEMDQAVAVAYGWSDLDFGHGFHETKQGVRFTISEPARREVLQRLLKLNHERYAEEVKQGLHGRKGAAKKASPKKKAASKPAKHEASLFDGVDDE